MNPVIVSTKELKNPRFNKMNPDVFCELYPFSIENGDIHLSSHFSESEARQQLDVIEDAEMDKIASQYPELTKSDFENAAYNADCGCEGQTFLELFAASCEGIKMEKGEQ